MDLVFLTPRAVDPGSHPAVAEVASLAEGVAERGHAVRWVRPRTPDETDVSVAGSRVIDVPVARVPFRAVAARLTDLATERVLSEELRRDPPDLLHVHGFGGGCSYLGPWVADRLGVPVVVVAEPIAESLCHRRTLVDECGSACSRWDESQRCATCCRAAGRRPGNPDGLGRVASFAARMLIPMAGLSPFPARVDFENRVDMIAQGLASARQIRVTDDAAASELARLGVPRRPVRVGVPDGVDAWEEAWAEVLDAGS